MKKKIDNYKKKAAFIDTDDPGDVIFYLFNGLFVPLHIYIYIYKCINV